MSESLFTEQAIQFIEKAGLDRAKNFLIGSGWQIKPAIYDEDTIWCSLPGVDALLIDLTAAVAIQLFFENQQAIENVKTLTAKSMMNRMQQKAVMPSQPIRQSASSPDAKYLDGGEGHYKHGDPTYEAIKVIEAWNLDFKLGNIVKYIARLDQRLEEERLKDLRDIAWYAQRAYDQELSKWPDGMHPDADPYTDEDTNAAG